MQSERSTTIPPTATPKATWRTRLPFFYGWVVVASVFLAQAITYGVYYSFSVFFVAMVEEFGWSRAATAGVFSLLVLVIGLTGVVVGALIDRLGPSRVVPSGAILLTLGLLATSQLSDLWQFYLFFGVVAGLGISTSGWVPCVTVVSRWFSNRRGLAIGIASAGIGLGIVAMVPISQYLISSFGWRSAYLILAGLSLVGIAPHAALLQLGRPEQLGLKPDGRAAEVSATPSTKIARKRELVVVDRKWASYPWTISSALRTARFWLLLANLLLSVLTNQMLWVHQVAYLVDTGYDKMLAASVAGFAGLVSMPGKIFWGMVADRLGRELTFTLGIATMLLAIGLLVLTGFVQAVWLVVVFAVTFALGYAINAPLTPSAAADIFAGRRFGSIYGLLNVGMGLGGAFGAWLAGYVFDVTGSYVVAFALAAVCSTASVLCMWLAAPRKVRRVVWTSPS